ncbi:MAG: C39 family peptidase [Akkermansiaceae bacterium]|nr:C39 family peptidase [Akkermansiaceae bacterium]
MALHVPCLAQTIAITQLKDAKTIEVSPIELSESEVRFQFQGRDFTISLEQLTPDSRERLQQWHQQEHAADQSSDAAINQAVGLPLFSAKTELWQEPAAQVARRLGWPVESTTKGTLSYRKYPGSDDRFLGARPYCGTLYGDAKDKTGSLSVVFANKGDFNSALGRGEDHFMKMVDGNQVDMTLNEAIERDATTIATLLREALGEPVEQRYGEKEDRRDVLRWDHRNHAFILSERENEYTYLLVVDRATADREGKVDFIKDSDFRDLLETNVSKEENGDVVITNIPMVDQGPKGYCAPATFERAMRYMNVPADMYLLATLATAPTGGTRTSVLAEEAKRIISSKARRIRELELEEDLDVRLVQRYIDKGVPILWQMASVDEYNEAANDLTRQRATVQDIDEWAKQVESAAQDLIPTLSNKSKHHICLIIGYNEKTSEIAVSDSWGPSYALRWIPVSAAKAVTTSGGFVIDL